jgi:hypothetical protein
MVLFSAIFHGVCLENFHQGRKLWKVAEAKAWSFLVNQRTFFGGVRDSGGSPSTTIHLRSSEAKVALSPIKVTHKK